VKLVRELMSTRIVTADPSTSVREAAAMMFRDKVGSLLVMNGGALVGIFTMRDGLRALTQDSADRGRVSAIERWMTAEPMTIDPDATAREALTLMVEGGFRHLPVRREGEVVGMLSMRDLSSILISPDAPSAGS
jgi:CBS domain-containing protein